MFEFVSRDVLGCFTAFCALILIAPGCAPGESPHTHAHPHPHAEEEGPDPVAVTVFTEKVELFMEYPRLTPGLEARFLAHVTVLATGEPVRSGQLRLELSGGAGPSKVLEAPEKTRDGLFIPVGSLSSPGRYEATIVVQSDQVDETVPLPSIVVHDNLAGARAAAEAEAREEPVGAVPFLLEQQWKIGLRMERVERRSLTERLQVAGVVEAPRDAMAVVSAPLAGLLLPSGSGRLPGIGDRVEQGQVLAFLEPPLTTSDAAQLDILDMELMIRDSDIRTRALEVEQALLQSEARLEFARRALSRIERLRAKDLGTEAELEAARRDVEIARREVEGSQALKSAYERARERVDGLRNRGAASGSGGSSRERMRLPLLAPISGEIVEAYHVEGEQVDSLGAVYRVLDLERVWITTHVSEFDLASVGDAPGALVEVPAYPGRTFDVIEAMGGRLVNVGRVVDPETRTIAVRYEANNPDDMFRAGMFVDVFLETGRAIGAVAIPGEAVVIDNGRPVAFALIDGEMFQKRDLDLGIRDGRYVEVRSGLEEGDRVVTRGAYSVKLASVSPSSFGEGHVH